MTLKLKDPVSAITHGIAMVLAMAGAIPLLLKAARQTNGLHIFALSIFILTMILLYFSSTLYHSIDSTEAVNRRLRKMDHMMISVMIAGSYTPVCLIVLHNRLGYVLCLVLQKENGQEQENCWETVSVSHGDALTRSIGEFPREEDVSILSQILMVGVPEKYYLSQKACLGILRRADARGKELPELLKKALLRQASS